MKPEIQKIWLDDLRSGKHPQGKHALHNEKGQFCCLGRLCAIAVDHGVIPPPVLARRMVNEQMQPVWVYGEQWAILPKAVRDWAGLESANPTSVDELMCYSSQNDCGTSFAEIADIIEKQGAI